MQIIRIILNESITLNVLCYYDSLNFGLYLFINWSCNDIFVILLIFLRNINN